MSSKRLTLVAGPLSVDLVPAMGAEIRSIRHERLGEVLWDFDVEPNRDLRTLSETVAPATDHASRWLDDYYGGWQILFPNAGSAARVNGDDHGYHGSASRVPWTVLSAADGEACLEAQVTPSFHVRRSVVADRSGTAVSLSTEITNTSDIQQPFLWFEHPAFPLTADMELSLSGTLLQVPRDSHSESMTLPSGGEAQRPRIPVVEGSVDVGHLPGTGVEKVFLASPTNPSATLTWPSLRRQITLRWDGELFPYLWIWIQNQAQRYPFLGRTACVALEPATSPTMGGLSVAAEHGFAQYLEPSATRATRIELLLGEY